ncbi:type I-C CRISPR-associated protein Cas8c/Csd1 [Pseudobacteroides cellulosolvens]|uniref:CRISPR-associated protein, Csd1 family n=1 Tax=Pseudobacteroides cellulosolvens ATCC 35603 = DSM 2933 TaxID=398512 RepID=A0A0L6JNS1_9FIRM|nr:type I-C CRISPR-associated protein Cas8c/Csd1 [Pseudobacteroides cellulosolvens]KNY27429.1 CRISPR-associated protein, Csd1 family [Pseudobacteroides cellulosolvens ATCC 35603 = DSM 2933]
MILQALNEYYQILLNNPDSGVAKPGYSSSKVSHAIVLSKDGDLLEIVSMMIEDNKKFLPKFMILPKEVQRKSNIKSNFLYDNISYVFGLEVKKEGQETKIYIHQKKFDAFKKKHTDLLNEYQSDVSVNALLRFVDKWNPYEWEKHIDLEKVIELGSGNNIIFKIEGIKGFLHENGILEDCITIDDEDEKESKGPFTSQCLITGEIDRIARTHKEIKGVQGAQSAGAAIVSFNKKSFESYKKEQSYNSPVGRKAMFRYTTALNYLLSSKINKVNFADITMVFWASREDNKNVEEMILAWSLDPFDPDKKESGGDKKQYVVDDSTARQAKEILEHVRNGLPVKSKNFDENTRCFLLGLAPNAARISIRFFRVNSFGEILEKIATHYRDLSIVGIERYGTFISPWRILKEVATLGKSENIPPLLGGQLIDSVLTGRIYPYSLYTLALSRVKGAKRDERDEPANPISVGIIKAFLLRCFRIQSQKEKEEMIKVGLNESLTNSAYRLGRLFSLLEKAQKDAIGKGINAGISDKYFGSASATPATVFPILLRLYRHHKSKLQKEGKGGYIDMRIQDVMNGLDSFPAHLNLEEQGMFVLGYYHQNQANYTKVEKEEDVQDE